MIKVRRFDECTGIYVEQIKGHSRYGYAIRRDGIDMYDMPNILEERDYQGQEIFFFDYETMQRYQPFQREVNVLYESPVYKDGAFCFLQADFNKKIITLFEYTLGEKPKAVTMLNTDEVNLYNLRIRGEGVYITSSDDEFVCYYPEKFSFKLEKNEGVEFMDEGKVYLSAWIEEGWDDEYNIPSDAYKYYDKVVVRDYQGNLISEEVGSLHQREDGSWWIS